MYPHVLLKEEGSRDLIPDYLLEIPTYRSFDIVDLKRPSARLSAGNRYKRLSSDLQKAVAQLRKYRQFFDSSSNRRKFVAEYGLEPFKPKVVVVMGRSAEFHSLADRKEIEEQLHEIRLVTYDDLLAFGRSRVVDVGRQHSLG